MHTPAYQLPTDIEVIDAPVVRVSGVHAENTPDVHGNADYFVMCPTCDIFTTAYDSEEADELVEEHQQDCPTAIGIADPEQDAPLMLFMASGLARECGDVSWALIAERDQDAAIDRLKDWLRPRNITLHIVGQARPDQGAGVVMHG